MRPRPPPQRDCPPAPRSLRSRPRLQERRAFRQFPAIGSWPRSARESWGLSTWLRAWPTTPGSLSRPSRPRCSVRRRICESFLQTRPASSGELDHPHIVRFQDQGWAGAASSHFVMDYVDGADAGTILKKDGPFAVKRAVRLTCQVLRALEYGHGKKLIHRDIKPGIMLIAGSKGREMCHGNGLRAGPRLPGVAPERFDHDRPSQRQRGLHASRTDHQLPERRTACRPVLGRRASTRSSRAGTFSTCRRRFIDNTLSS